MTSKKSFNPGGFFKRILNLDWNLQDYLIVYSLLVLLVSFFAIFVGYQYPNSSFWDENYHIASAEKYIQGVYFQEPHPPLGKMIIAAGETLLQPNKNLDKSEFVTTDYIKNFPAGFSYQGYRLFPTILATLCPLIFYFILFYISKNPHLSFIFTSIYLFDNAIIGHSRSAMLESSLMFFSLLSILAFVKSWQREKPILTDFLWLSVTTGLAAAVKVNALILGVFWVALILKLALPELFKKGEKLQFKLWQSSRLALISGLYLFLGFWFIFGSINALHYDTGRRILNNRTYETSPEFLNKIASGEKSLEFYLESVFVWDKFAKNYAKGVPPLKEGSPTENGSYPLDWLVGRKSINYLHMWYPIRLDEHRTYLPPDPDSLSPKLTTQDYKNLPQPQKLEYTMVVRYKYLQGNPVVWGLSLLGFILALALIIARFALGLKVTNKNLFNLICVFSLATIAYFATVINVDRVLYMYHYFVPLVFNMILTFLVFCYLYQEKFNVNSKFKRRIYYSLAATFAILFASFVWYAPFTYYLPLSEQQFNQRVLFEFWGLIPKKDF